MKNVKGIQLLVKLHNTLTNEKNNKNNYTEII